LLGDDFATDASRHPLIHFARRKAFCQQDIDRPLAGFSRLLDRER